MDIDTDWCLNCGKQTNGELYCSSFCRNQDEKSYKLSSSPSDFGSFSDNSSIASGRTSPSISSNNKSSKYLNNPGKLLYYQGNDLKFRNRPSYDAGFYSPCLSSGLSQWLNQNQKIVSSKEQINNKYFVMESGNHEHKCHNHNGRFTSGFKGSFSSASSECSYSSSSETVIFGSSSSSNDSLSKGGFAVNEPYYPWHKTEDDDDISLYEY